MKYQEIYAYMNYPKMILFDYGNTLLCEPNWSSVRGNTELMKYITKNPNNHTLADIQAGANLIFGKHVQAIRDLGYDVGGRIGNRVLYEYLGIEFSLTPLEMETVFWTAASAGVMMPDADVMLDYLQENNIRCGVISNLLWSGEALTERLARFFPKHTFEFVMTSSDYLFRKPNRLLFDIALQKCDLDAKDVWYCGDNPIADIEGASQAGIFPVWYDNELESDHHEHIPACEHLHIHEWSEMIALLDSMKPTASNTANA